MISIHKMMYLDFDNVVPGKESYQVVISDGMALF